MQSHSVLRFFYIQLLAATAEQLGVRPKRGSALGMSGDESHKLLGHVPHAMEAPWWRDKMGPMTLFTGHMHVAIVGCLTADPLPSDTN